MPNSVDPDQTAPIVKFVSNVLQLFAADDFSRRHFSDAFFLGALRVKGTNSFPAGANPFLQSK